MLTATGATARELPYTPAYEQFLCALERSAALENREFQQEVRNGQNGVSRKGRKSARAAGMERTRKIRDAYTGGSDRPWPNPFQKSVHRYRPTVLEMAETIWRRDEEGCTRRRPAWAKALGPRFKCPLNRVIFRDGKTGKRFRTDAANLDAYFVYDFRSEKQRELRRPQRLGAGMPAVFGGFSVRGTYDGKPLVVSRGWIDGSPTRKTFADDRGETFRAGGPVPVVTAKTAALYSFNVDPFGGPNLLEGHHFVPTGCR
jgi:hypothetical protein